MTLFRFAIAFTCLLLPFRSGAEVDLLADTESPSQRLALGTDSDEKYHERLWLLELPSKRTLGKPLIEKTSFVGMVGHGKAVWNRRRSLVAVTQGGIPFAETRLYRFSKKWGLKELPFPDLEILPYKQYHFANLSLLGSSEKLHPQRCYVEVDRWLGRDKLLMSVSGTAVEGPEGHLRYWRYDLSVTLRFNPRDHARVVRISKTPLEEI